MTFEGPFFKGHPVNFALISTNVLFLPFQLNDIAILVLKTPIKFTSTVRQVCHPSSTTDTYAGKMGTVAGWGELSLGGPNTLGPIPNVLMELTVKILSDDECNRELGIDDKPDIILCAGKKGKSSCRVSI